MKQFNCFISLAVGDSWYFKSGILWHLLFENNTIKKNQHMVLRLLVCV